MGCAVGTVKSQVSAGLAKLRQQLGDDAGLLPLDTLTTGR
jgi:DNA-directed RNA polymerase specialized sigma24 family protein